MAILPGGDQERIRWLSQLERLRQPWPEWERLIDYVHGHTFMLESPDDIPFELRYLNGPADERKGRLIRICLSTFEEQLLEKSLAMSPIFPHYIPAVLGLKYTDSMMMSGGVVGALEHICHAGSDGKLPEPITPDHVYTIGNLFGMSDFSDVDWPSKPIYPLQSNSSGLMFCINEMHRVIGFSVSKNSFIELGGVDTFLRFCINAALGGKDWATNYNHKIGSENYDLKFIDDIGAD
jgi:hypothetical protein